MTSFQAVSIVRKLTGEKKVGHAGTLDPEATGVLPICLGQGTRVVEYFHELHKTYVAEIMLGVTSDTDDGEGQLTPKADSSWISWEILEMQLGNFRGKFWQTPPNFSAIKSHGQPIYKLARAGIDYEPKQRLVTVYHLELKDWQPPVATIEVTCGKGTYIRSIARDLGNSLACGGYLKSLVRTWYGIFNVDNAITLEEFETAVQTGYWSQLLSPIDSVMPDIPQVAVTPEMGADIIHGKPVALPVDSPENLQKVAGQGKTIRCRAYSIDGKFIGVLVFTVGNGLWQPEKVFKAKLD